MQVAASASQPLLARLRAATSDLHERLERVALEQAAVASLEGLARHLWLLFEHHRALLARLEAFPEFRALLSQRLGALHHDLSLLPSTGERGPSPRFDVPEITSWEQALGTCYVTEGARLGGLAIAKKLKAAGLSSADLKSVGGDPTAIRQQWEQLLELLRSVPPIEHASVVHGAVVAFRTLYVGYSGYAPGS